MVPKGEMIYLTSDDTMEYLIALTFII